MSIDELIVYMEDHAKVFQNPGHYLRIARILSVAGELSKSLAECRLREPMVLTDQALENLIVFNALAEGP